MVKPEPPIVTRPGKESLPSCWETVLLTMIAWVLLLAGCSRALTPGSAVQPKLGLPNDIFAPTLEDVQVLGIRDWPGDPQQKIVLFRARLKAAQAGAYILVGLNAGALCELRMLDANKRVVSLIDLSPPESNCAR